MFYCEKCRQERDWPKSLMRSRGPCELCGQTESCYNVFSFQLPKETKIMPETTKKLVLYHGGGCMDGFCAAWVMRLAYPNAEFRAVNYGQPAPDVSQYQDGVFIVDFCYSAPEVLAMADQVGKKLIVLDHHKTTETVQKVLKSVDRHMHLTFDQSRSGARLTWDMLYKGNALPAHIKDRYSPGEAPWLIEYVEDRDLWKWELHNSKQVNAGLRSRPQTFEEWDLLFQYDGPSELAQEGEVVLRLEEQMIAKHVKNAVEIDYEGHRVPCVNATMLQSEIGHALCQGKPFSITYFDRLEDQKCILSFRSDEQGLDVSELAKQLGGGGHMHAAGAELPAFFSGSFKILGRPLPEKSS